MKAAGLVGALVGAVIGAGVGYIIGTRIQVKKNDEDLANMEKYYKEKYGKTATDILREKANKDHNAPKTKEKSSDDAIKLQTEKFKTFDRITPVKAPVSDYAKMYRKEDTNPLEDHGPDYLDSDEEKSMARELQPMIIISPEEYDQEAEYTKTELTYYEYDELFTDAFGVQIPTDILSPDDVGRGNLDHFGISGEDGVLYVRDEENNADYKIFLEESAYEGSTY